MNTTLEGKVALVTGGTKGIGKAIAAQLHAAGAQVIITARNTPTDQPTDLHFIASDLTNADSSTNLANQILEKYGKIDIIVNNAGANLSPGGGFNTLKDENWENDWQLNFLSVVRLNKLLLPSMIAQKSGVIIHISTGAAKQPIWEMTMSYSAAKAALNVYSKALANELGNKGIRVNVVSPGLVNTPLMQDFIHQMAASAGQSDQEVHDSLINQVGVPLGTMAEPTEIASLVTFLASDQARYITGVNYSVDGGALPVV